MCKRKIESIEGEEEPRSHPPHSGELRTLSALLHIQDDEIQQIMQDGTKKIECDLCGFRCVQRRRLDSHRLTHFTDALLEKMKKKIEKKAKAKKKAKDKLMKKRLKKKNKKLKMDLEKKRIKRKVGIYPCDHLGCNYTSKTKHGLIVHKQTHVENAGIYSCTEEGCDFTTIYPGGLKRHMDTHNGTKDFECDLCDFRCAQKSNLANHRATHFEERAFSCTWNGCDYTSKTQSAMITHTNTHTRKNVFPCDHPGCDHEALTRGGLEKHQVIHSDERKYVCPVNGCDFTCKYKQYMDVHMMVHNGDKNYVCPHPGCLFKTAYSTSFMFHKRGHVGDKRYGCEEDGCKYRAISPQALKLHMMTHTGIYPFVCKFPGCGYRCGQKNDLVRHKNTHSLDSQTRRLKQESRVYDKLLEWGYAVDRETVINASQGDCVPDTDRHFSRLDFHIANCTNVILIVECDELQHQWYNMRCEMGRMMDVQSSLVSQGYTQPMYWLRYNPNGKYFVGEEQIPIRRPEREEELKRKIETICDPDFTPEKQTTIHYMFYDLISEEDGPKILNHDEFPESMCELVSW